MNETQAIQMLQAQPLEFLLKNSITPTGASVEAGIHKYYMIDDKKDIKRPGKYLGNLRKHAGQVFKVRPISIFGGKNFDAIHIPVQASTIKDYKVFKLPADGPGIMITTQLTGCCIVIKSDANSWSVAHIQPKGGETGIALRRRLALTEKKVYGKTDYVKGSYATLIGVRKNKIWDFYTQEQDIHSNVISAKKL